MDISQKHHVPKPIKANSEKLPTQMLDRWL